MLPFYFLCALPLPWLIYRTNRFFSRRALNNATPASFDWNKEIVVITGGSNGIGAATARLLAGRKTTVVILDILPLSFDPPENLHYYRCDITQYADLQAAAEIIRREVGAPTCVIANAGICRGRPLLQATERDVEQIFSVNSLGLIWTIKTFVPDMVSRNHGHLVIMASQTAHLATAGITAYAATKSAALAVYEGVHTELRHHAATAARAVRVSCVAPSAVSTAMFAGIQMPPGIELLSAEAVAEGVAQVVWSGESQNVSIPSSSGMSAWMRALPDWTRVALQDFGKDVMKNLTVTR
ncbi:hypothetical protein ASPZODRAFT_125899 [Penicilliopsis zonata CBS 506.65]|uniref:Uncharacterized protein n=1 Tax=Penicilliopsis zonata CBS 506.65 TaxID=1073090 RepID=A0A1L9S4U8_9EURO|nr:hypothetical protein ASPZODRAFT_125899 [Penicilliopsis zonata CBS 506.65]OJJ42190.1 hypothetical protein ASPZODRAFT_125899 [Penicilliopsis zonata CBS 506.65]